jgi:energy-converting hydrogenase Eha subunit H
MGILLRRTAFLVCFFAALAGSVAAQVLNMSHDLTTLGIANQNLTPNNSSLDARPLFQAALNYVQIHPVQTLTLDTGAYYLLTNTQANAVVLFPNLSNMTIDLAGSTIYFVGPQLPNGLQLYYCSSVTLTNFQIDYIHPPYTHVQLTSVDTVNRLLKYQTLPNWPDPASFNTLTDPFSGGPIEGYWAAIFRNGLIVPGTSRTLLQAPFTNNTLTIQDMFPWAQSSDSTTLLTLAVSMREQRSSTTTHVKHHRRNCFGCECPVNAGGSIGEGSVDKERVTS